MTTTKKTPKTPILIPKMFKKLVSGNNVDAMRATLSLIGQGITKGSRYAPIRLRAAQSAAKAGHKDYFGQVKAVYKDFLKRWRYVRDPFGREMVTISPPFVYEYVLGGDRGIGAGDCDDATVAMGALLTSIGFPVRIATTANPNERKGNTFSHVFPQVLIPGFGWITVDPVVYPSHGLGFTPKNSRLAIWSLSGNLISKSGNVSDLSDSDTEDHKMNYLEKMTDYAGLGEYYGDNEDLPDFRKVAVKEFGAYAETMGIRGGRGLLAEVETDQWGRSWTPILELAPHDYEYLNYNKKPYDGMLALSDDLTTYQYDSQLGFFKNLFKKIRKGFRKATKAILKRIPGGKYLLKLGQKLWKITAKMVRPLMKLIGPIAKKLAPIAALIPGYGPAIAAGLHTAGKIADLMKKTGISLASSKKGVSRIAADNPKALVHFKRELEKSAAQEKKRIESRKFKISKGIKPATKRSALRAQNA